MALGIYYDTRIGLRVCKLHIKRCGTARVRWLIRGGKTMIHTAADDINLDVASNFFN